jgi:hypothetical protein
MDQSGSEVKKSLQYAEIAFYKKLCGCRKALAVARDEVMNYVS